ncbi:TRAP transporter large permease [Pseudorhodoplanes sp.]|uniref:TRAP transporter large permease n=1 Tax=Pseudorhodoplanes sp. TaxID=1934341 RepID=UPI003D1516A1
MPLNELLAVCLLVAVCLGMLSGFPVAFTLAGVSIAFAAVGSTLGQFDFALYSAIPSRYFGVMTNEVLVAVPLFVFMGFMLERSKISQDLLITMGQCFGARRGGIGISVMVVGMLLAASTGIVGATVVTMGVLSLPTMLKAGYDKKLAVGTICASGTLGQIIPPSIALVILADSLSGIYTESQLAKGNYIVEPFSALDLFAGALIPGLLLVGLYILWLVVVATLRPDSCPAYYDSDMGRREVYLQVAKALVPPCVLILAVLGSILAGVATPTEAASFGGVGAMTLALIRRQLTLNIVKAVALSTVRVSCMVFAILLGASIFSLTFRGLGGDDLVKEFLTGLPGGFLTAMLIVMMLVFLLGFVLDFIEIIFIVVPIVAPALFHSDISPVWLGIMLAINLQTSFMTPPFGWALFYMRGVAPKSVATLDIYKGVAPFIGIQLVVLVIVWIFPTLSTWLPKVLLG